MIVVLSRCMRHGNDLPVEQSKREEPLFAVGFSRVFGSDCVAGKNLLCVCEVNAMIVEVFLALVLVPGGTAAAAAPLERAVMRAMALQQFTKLLNR